MFETVKDTLGFTLNITTKSLKPKPIPLDVKIIMIGDTR